MVAANTVTGYVLQDCCRWFELEVDSVDATEARSLMPSTVVFTGERRPFFGFNRARHAVLEAAIIATRIHLLDWTTINQAFEFLAPAVSKTGGPIEKDSFEMLREYVQTRRDASS